MLSQHTALVWFRNDLRIHDHDAWNAACSEYKKVVGVYILDTDWLYAKSTLSGLPKVGSHRLQFLLESLSDLRLQLRKRGSDLIIRVGSTNEELLTLCGELNCKAVFAHEEVTDEEITIDALLEVQLEAKEIGLYLYWGSTLYHADDLAFESTQIPDGFTAFRKKIETLSFVRSVIPTATPHHSITVDEYDKNPIPTLSDLDFTVIETDSRNAILFKGGETAALERLRYYLFESKLISTYKQSRNGLLGADYSTKFSPWLSLGCISPRMIYQHIQEYEKQHGANDSTYWVIFELLWRDFFRFSFLKHENRLFQHRGILADDQAAPSIRVDKTRLEAWATGNTGIPFIDANMRELLHTGFMSNRGRQNVASYLVHVLDCDWRWGAEWFEYQLIDYDPCSNWGNWAYLAGVGHDPRSRYFNVVKQAHDYDPKGTYIKHWIPELSSFGKDIFTPYKLANDQWKLNGVQPNMDYPKADIDPEIVYQKKFRSRK